MAVGVYAMQFKSTLLAGAIFTGGTFTGPTVQRALRTIGCIFLLALSSIALVAQQADPRETKLLVLERMWNEAQVNHDAQALDQLVSSRFVNTEWDGSVSDKQKFLADIKDPLFKPNLATIQDVKMNFFGDTAVVTGTYHTAGTYQGHPYDHVGRFTDTWIMDMGKWQCVASHTSLIKK
jgi:ketosteroid isomerase-like protein